MLEMSRWSQTKDAEGPAKRKPIRSAKRAGERRRYTAPTRADATDVKSSRSTGKMAFGKVGRRDNSAGIITKQDTATSVGAKVGSEGPEQEEMGKDEEGVDKTMVPAELEEELTPGDGSGPKNAEHKKAI